MKKTKVLRLNTKNQEPIVLGEEARDDVDTFDYLGLGATASSKGGTEQEIGVRLGKARAAYNKLNKIWQNSQLSRNTKVRIFRQI